MEASRRGQACDRCRRRKVKCDGNVPSCSNCLAAGLMCESSDTLQRNRKVRGYVRDAGPSTEELRQEIAKLNEQLEEERRISHQLRLELSKGNNDLGTVASGQTASTNRSQVFQRAETRKRLDTAHVIKHMGRLVYDEDNIGRFAGITTGSFLARTLGVLCSRWPVNESARLLSSSCNRLFLMSPHSSLKEVNSQGGTWSTSCSNSSHTTLLQDIYQLLQYPGSSYSRHIELFVHKWGAFCPIILSAQLEDDVSAFLQQAQGGLDSTVFDYDAAMTLLMILAINHLDPDNSTDDIGSISELDCIRMACRLRPFVTSRAGVRSLQALCLFAFYHQLEGQASRLAELSGILVRMAQSLGLHRHSQRFTVSVGENELRKRLWWWVYAFDKVAAVALGLPRLISDANVDSEMPEDCTLTDTNTLQLDYPLPGDVTPVWFFNQYVSLMRILSLVLDQLYTTKDRYNGNQKIVRLEKDLQSWSHAFSRKDSPGTFDTGDAEETIEEQGNELMIAWLKPMARLVSHLISRPGLTFDSNSPAYSACLTSCTESARELVESLDPAVFPAALRKMSPIAPSIAFQCGLLIAYSHCMSGNTEPLNTEITISRAIRVLADYKTTELNAASPLDLRGENHFVVSLCEAVTVLHSFLQPSPHSQGSVPSSHGYDARHTGIPVDQNPSLDIDALELFRGMDQDLLDSLETVSDPYLADFGLASLSPSSHNLQQQAGEPESADIHFMSLTR